jgi:hypothetical protein
VYLLGCSFEIARWSGKKYSDQQDGASQASANRLRIKKGYKLPGEPGILDPVEKRSPGTLSWAYRY